MPVAEPLRRLPGRGHGRVRQLPGRGPGLFYRGRAMKKEDVELKVELLTLGAVVSEEGWDAYKRSAGFQIYLDDLAVSVPAWGKYKRYKHVERSPFLITREGERWELHRDGEFLREIRVNPRPAFYDMKTTDGVDMWRVLHVCGDNCLLTGVRQTCSLMKGGQQCRFCGTIFNPRYEGRLDRKTPLQLAEAVEAGMKEGMIDVMLSSGVTKTPDRGVRDIAEAARAIKDRVDVRIQAEVAVPEDPEMLREFEGVVDCISLNVETLDQRVREEICPGKSKIPYEDYFRAFDISLELFGENQVNSWLIAGMGESDESVLMSAARLAEAGVYPYLVALRPSKLTGLEDQPPPSPERLGRLCKEVAGIVKDAGLRPEKNRAGCIRCSACSAVKDYVNL
ncbi:MAG: radical SAM protein [Methanobacteriota archaeon]|nr:MAG: radical SAM protein [Euryarchaeota archaeon]